MREPPASSCHRARGRSGGERGGGDVLGAREASGGGGQELRERRPVEADLAREGGLLEPGAGEQLGEPVAEAPDDLRAGRGRRRKIFARWLTMWQTLYLYNKLNGCATTVVECSNHRIAATC